MSQLNQKQSQVMKLVHKGNNLFIGGPGGVGKSYLVKHIMEHFGSNTVLMAPTGIAALNIGGATIHSTFKFPTSILTKAHHGRISEKVRDLFDVNGPVQRIIIDEVSMVRADMLEAIDKQLRKIRRRNTAFGGIQMIVVGDFYQLPPVVTPREKAAFSTMFDVPYAFGGNAWAEGNFEYVELDEIMRQQDETFIDHLQTIRRKLPSYQQSVAFFNETGTSHIESVLDEDPVFICSTNKSADAINVQNYEELDGEEIKLTGTVSGQFDARPSPLDLRLKYGTKVIMTANTDKCRNGEVGYFLGMMGDRAIVMKEDTEEEILLAKNRWEERDYSVGGDGSLQSYPTGSYEQYPLRHGWAVTVHRCQGLSLSHGVIDMGRGAFASGQTYVALSRIRTLEGLGLMSPLSNRDIIVDPAITEFYEDGCKGIALGFV